jgi:hypothetical protein
VELTSRFRARDVLFVSDGPSVPNSRGIRGSPSSFSSLRVLAGWWFDLLGLSSFLDRV